MGLDMYLHKRHYFSEYGNSGLVEAVVSRHASIRPERVRVIDEAVCTWRKANHIHRWFVENIQNGEDNCHPYEVSADQLRELLGVCRWVKAEPARAPELLPTAEGFFFGGTEYDDYYWESLDHTIDTIAGELAIDRLTGEDVWYVYSSSW